MTNYPLEVERVLDRWKEGLKVQASVHVEMKKRINEDAGLPFTDKDKADQEECWLDRYWVHFDDEAGEWRLSDGLGGWGTVLVYNPEQGAWFTDCSYTGSRTDGPFEQSQAEDLAELIWTG